MKIQTRIKIFNTYSYYFDCKFISNLTLTSLEILSLTNFGILISKSETKTLNSELILISFLLN